MKLHILCTDNYPNNGACSLIIRNVLKNYSGHFFDEIHVVTLSYTFYTNKTEVLDGIIIDRLKCDSFLPLSSLSEIKNPFLKTRIRLLKVFRKFINLFFSPFDLFVEHAYSNYLKKSNISKGDIIVSFLGHYEPSKALVNVKLHNIKRVLYQVDPCSNRMNVFGHAKKRLLELEKLVYKKYDGFIFLPTIFNQITFPFKNQKQICLIDIPNVHPISANKTLFLNNPDFLHTKIKLVYSGRIYKGIRDATYALDFLTHIHNYVSFTLFMVGVSYFEIPKQYRNCDFIKCIGLQSIDVSNKYLASSDFLINIGNNVTNQLPSKLFDYFSYGKPIINFSKSNECVTLPYLEKYNLHITIFENKSIDLQANEVVSFLLKYIGASIKYEEIQKTFYQCTSEYCSRQFFMFLSTIIDSTND